MRGFLSLGVLALLGFVFSLISMVASFYAVTQSGKMPSILVKEIAIPVAGVTPEETPTATPSVSVRKFVPTKDAVISPIAQ